MLGLESCPWLAGCPPALAVSDQPWGMGPMLRGHVWLPLCHGFITQVADMAAVLSVWPQGP